MAKKNNNREDAAKRRKRYGTLAKIGDGLRKAGPVVVTIAVGIVTTAVSKNKK